MDRVLFHILDQAFFSIGHVLKGAVVRQHGDDGLSRAGISHLIGRMSAVMDQLLLFGSGSIVDRNAVADPEQVCRHAGPHLTQSNKSNIHDYSLKALFS